MDSKTNPEVALEELSEKTKSNTTAKTSNQSAIQPQQGPQKLITVRDHFYIT